MQPANKHHLAFQAIIFFTLISAGYFNATRALNVGADNVEYINFFYSGEYLSSRFEPLFKLLASSLNLLNLSHEYLFFSCYMITTLTIIHFTRKAAIQNTQNTSHFIVIAFVLAFLHSSSWYISSTITALRHALAIPLIWLSFNGFYERKNIDSIVYIILASLFHYSSVLFIPFIIMCRMERKYVFLACTTASLLYLLGINEKIIMGVSSPIKTLTGYDFYLSIKNYGLNLYQMEYYGFNWLYFAYSLFWFLFYYIVSMAIKDKAIEKLWAIYSCSIMVFFVFGFGGFANRYAFAGWVLLPVIHGLLLYKMISIFWLKTTISLFFLTASAISYILFMRDIGMKDIF